MKNRKLTGTKINLSGENTAFFLIMLPFMILFFIFNILPVLASIVLSMFDYDMVSRPILNGFDNYIRMVTDDELFFKVVGNTLRFSIVAGPLSFILAFLLAWMINEFTPMVRVILTFVFYAPALVGNAYFIWQVFFSSDSYGYMNSILMNFGLINEPINWFQSTEYNMTLILIVQLWMSMGVSFLANIAGLQNVNTELYEAGAIDGIHNRWQELWYLTLPSMKHMLLFGAVMQIQSSFSVGAIAQTMIGYPSVEHSVDTIVLLMTDVGTVRYELGYASAMAVVLFIMMFTARIIVGKLFGKKD